jgi:hypothetical protein
LREARTLPATTDGGEGFLDSLGRKGDAIRHFLFARSGFEHVKPRVIAGKPGALEIHPELLAGVEEFGCQPSGGLQPLMGVGRTPHRVSHRRPRWIALTHQFGRGLAIVDPNRAKVLGCLLGNVHSPLKSWKERRVIPEIQPTAKENIGLPQLDHSFEMFDNRPFRKSRILGEVTDDIAREYVHTLSFPELLLLFLTQWILTPHRLNGLILKHRKVAADRFIRRAVEGKN